MRTLILAFLIGIFYSTPLLATHIVGGEMNYTCLGNNEYEITLTIYRDCFYGNPNAYFDDPASIGVFDVNNALVQEILVPLMGDDTLAPVLTNECLVVPPDVCVHTTTYSTTVTLPPVIGGYQLAYQRCCRNQTIANIVAPLETGATFGVTITERALLECNSSAQFLQWPPLYICANEPIIFDQSAFDADGDSIVYRLCTPLTGADPDVPRPQPPNDPPYDEVIWIDPPYNESNMLNGTSGGVPLQINAQTGLLTGVPNTVGQFVVGICVEEYRDGELISTTRRDFQYNVGICGQTTAAFFAPEIQCSGLSVEFFNQSAGTEQFLWVFGDPDNPAATSTQENPTYTYSDTGQYEITLIAAPGEVCADTFSQVVSLQFESLFPDFTLDTLSCGDSLVVQLTDFSVDTISSIVSWEWFINGESTAAEPDPSLTFTEAGIYNLNLLVTAGNGCQAQQSTTLAVSFIEQTLANDTVFLCPGVAVFLNPAFNNEYDYLWSPSIYLDGDTLPNPLAQPEESTTYTVAITDPLSGCMVERSIHLEVVEPIAVDLGMPITSCADSIVLSANSNTAIRYFWSDDPLFATIDAEGPTYTVGPIGQATYYVLVIDEAGCVAEDSVVVNSQAVNLMPLTQDTFICLGESATLSLENQDPDDEWTVDWTPTEFITSGDGTASIVIQPTVAGEQPYTYSVTNQWDCTLLDTILVTTLDTTDQSSLLEYAQCAGYHVHFSSSSVNAPIYQWHFGDPEQPDAMGVGAAVDYNYPGPGTYEVQVTLPSFVPCPDTLSLLVTLGDSPVDLALDWSYESCGEEAEILLESQVVHNEATIESWEWWIGDTLQLTGETVALTLSESTELPVSLIVRADNGCVDTLSELLLVPLIDLNLADTLQICPGSSVPLNPGGSPEFSYQWSPDSSLDDPSNANPVASPQVSTLYSVQITDPNSICAENGSVFAFVPSDYSYEITPDTAICADEWLLSVDADTPLEVIWATNANFTEIVGIGPEVFAPIVAQSTFYAQLTDTFGCQRIEEVLIDNQSVQLLLEPQATICVGDTLELNVVSFGPYPASTYQWSPQNAILSGANTATIQVSPATSTTYFLTATNEAGCSLDTSVTVNIFNFVPPLSIVPSLDTIYAGESIILNATDDAAYTYEWSPASTLDDPTIPNPVATPEETTEYLLVIRDPNGCVNTAEVLLIVLNPLCQEPYLFVPNAFSPNGDNLNEVLRVEGNLIEEMYLAIYDRWGELVFESRNQEDTWDGTFRNRALPPDVYGYVLEVKCIGGAEYFKKGNISLIR